MTPRPIPYSWLLVGDDLFAMPTVGTSTPAGDGPPPVDRRLPGLGEAS